MAQRHIMIPEFPQFKALELSDKEAVEAHTKKFPPYSDFNFVSMWSWDVKGEMGISQLNGNLVVRFTDYINGKPFFSFLGDNMVNETVETLLEYSKEQGLELKLELVPEDCIKNVDKDKFNLKEDRDDFDYVYDIPVLAEFKGGIYETHRNLIHQFLKNNENREVKVIDFSEIRNKNDIISLFTKWIENKGDSLLAEEYKNEFLALNKLLSIPDPNKFNLICFAVYVGDKMVGFIINENMGENSIIHFEKADTCFKGCYPFLMKHNSRMLNSLNVKLMNFEQDLGVESLRFTKNKFRPVNFLKKYLITV